LEVAERERLSVDTIDHRMQSFVAWHGEVPAEARRLEDFEAREHVATWIRRNIGVGVIHSYAIGYQLEDRWWTLFFERIHAIALPGGEVWHVEAYDHSGKSWSGRFLFWPELSRWWRLLHPTSG
jgi:hypothetical protein